ncbi:hypothetical protein QBC32DRAFT_374849 [Pseudoneurospora amorphoporcata]|uniref:Uncharacterized protein n=1 Tax=Pseudoneurospora amorphoporcata TaxID=241081 RepID=A0AAN6P3A3_9PEZI|nr:hypothetical protein QBC32DRAFT_374849 [Pseudoneurospora amorphoporcata]
MYARLKTLTSAEMQQSGHGEALNHVQRTASNTVASGPQQPTPVAQLDTHWTQIEHSLLEQISRITHHSINIGYQMVEDLQRVVSQIDDFVRGVKSRFEEIQTLVSKFSVAVENSKGNAPASAENSRAQSAQGTKIYQLLSERYILGFLRVLVPLFTTHPTMGTTEALLMLRIEGCRREWIPSLTRMLKVAFGGNPEAEWNQCEYLQRQARIRGLWLCWQLVTSGNEWAICAIADPTNIPNQSGGYNGSSQNSTSPTAATTTPARATTAACKQSNHSHSSNYPSPYISSFQMNLMANTGNYGQQPQHFVVMGLDTLRPRFRPRMGTTTTALGPIVTTAQMDVDVDVDVVPNTDVDMQAEVEVRSEFERTTVQMRTRPRDDRR